MELKNIFDTKRKFQNIFEKIASPGEKNISAKNTA